MKPLIRLRYILFFTIILGFFAAFAQNDYGLKLIAYSELLISITFLIALFTGYKNAENKIWFVAANILGSYSFFAFYLVDTDTKNGNTFLNAAIVLLLVFFLLYGIYCIIQNKTQNRIIIYLLSMFFLSSIFALYTGFIFPLPLKSTSMYFAIGILLFVCVIMIFQKRKLIITNENILLKKMKQLPDLLIIIYVFFLWWSIYWVMGDLKILPRIYSSLAPPALQKLFDEGENERADSYAKNYFQFLENRKEDNQ